MSNFIGKSPIISVMANACYSASKYLRRDFNEISFLKVSYKGANDFVTSADHKAADTIITSLLRTNPSYGIICEEKKVVETNSSYSWVIDPLDGTRNFIHNLPYWGISIALIRHIDKDNYETEAAVFYDPLREEMFWAEKSLGAFMNDRRISVSKRSALSSSIFATGFTTMQDCESAKILSSRVRRLGSNTMHFAYVAAGRFDAAWEHVDSVWDIAVGQFLIEKAKGVLTDFDDTVYKNQEFVLASNGLIHPQIIKHLKVEDRS